MEAAEQAVDQVTTAWKAAIEDETRAERHSTAIDAHRQNAQSHLETARAAAEADPFDETKHPEDARKAAQRAGDERRAVEQLQTQTESQDPEKALASTREVAKGWVTGVTGLFGLFGLGSIVFANDAVSGLRGEKFWGIPAEPVFGISALIAVVAGAWAMRCSLRAAHGWPRSDLRGLPQPEQLKPAEYFRRRSDPSRLAVKAAKDLQGGLTSAAVALGALVIAVASLWLTSGAEAERALAVDVTSQAHGDRIVCGELLELNNESILVRDDKGNLVPVNQEDAFVEQVAGC